MTDRFVLNDIGESRLADVQLMNHAAQPAVNGLSIDEVRALQTDACHFRGAFAGERLAGFLLVLPVALDYTSLNYRWFSDRYNDFVYVDRIVIAPEFQGDGLGRLLYEELITHFSGRAAQICAEVNVIPRNDVSLAFHERLGFSPVGEQATEGGSKRVSLMVRPLLAQAQVQVR